MTKYNAQEWIDFALNLCRGDYQCAIVTGRARLSGADLAGKAKTEECDAEDLLTECERSAIDEGR